MLLHEKLEKFFHLELYVFKYGYFNVDNSTHNSLVHDFIEKMGSPPGTWHLALRWYLTSLHGFLHNGYKQQKSK